MEKQKRIFYEWFPNPNEINPCDFKQEFLREDGYNKVKSAWRQVFLDEDEWSDKLPDKMTEGDVARWRAFYDKFCDIIRCSIEKEYWGYYGVK